VSAIVATVQGYNIVFGDWTGKDVRFIDLRAFMRTFAAHAFQMFNTCQ
jgi:hypothetical protein